MKPLHLLGALVALLPVLAFGQSRVQTTAFTQGALLQVDAASFRTYIGAAGGGGSGTVTSVGLALPNIFNLSGTPVTASGTLTGTLANQAPNLVFAGPSSGGSAAPTFRALVAADLPASSGGTVTSVAATVPGGLTIGGSPITSSGTLAFGATSVAGFWKNNGSGVTSWAAPVEGDLSWSDVTTLNVSTSKHGLVPKLPNDAAKFLDGTGVFSAPPGGGGGSVTSVGLTLSGGFTVTGSPVTTSGTLAAVADSTAGFFKNNGSGVTSWAAPVEGDLSWSDITTLNVSTTKHGLVPKLPNNAAVFLNGAGGFTTPAGGGTVTSVGLTMPAGFTITGSPVTGSGTLAVTAQSAAGFLRDDGSGGTSWSLAPLTNNQNSAVHFTNAASGLVINPTGTNVLLTAYQTNSAGGLVTNTLSMGSTGYNVQSQNTNNVNTITVTQDGVLSVGTNGQFGVDASGNGTLTGTAAWVGTAPTGGTYRSNNVSAIPAFSSATNSVAVSKGGTDYLLVSATPVNFTNAIGGVAGYIYSADITVSNSVAAAFTNRFDPSWIARGYSATNAATTLGIRAAVVPASGEIFVHVETRGINETNYWISY